jgi:hypothetical protein
LEEHLFRWDEVKWGEVTEKDKKRIIEFIIHNYDPKLLLSAKIEKIDPKTIKITDEKSTIYLTLEADKGKLIVKIAEKTDELILKKDIDKKDSKEFIVYPTNSAQGPGDRFVGPIAISLALSGLILLSAIIVYGLVQLWPSQELVTNVSATIPAAKSPVQFWPFPWKVDIWDENRLFLLVVLAGALGSLVHALRSFYWYVGNRELVWSWLPMYILLPVAGAMLALIFYIVIRGGLFPQSWTVQVTTLINPFGLVAISALVGLFSVEAALKLRDIAETVFKKAGEGRESKPQVSEEDKYEKN